MRDYAALNIEQRGSETDPFTPRRYRQFYHFLRRKEGVVLDLGCNTGRGGMVLKELNPGLSIVGLDVVESRLHRLPPGIYDRVILAPITNIPVEDGSFDAVVAGEVIEHLYPKDVQCALEEIFRVLRISGQVLLTTPNPSDIKRKLRGESILGGAHLSQHWADIMKLRLRMAGFSRVKIYGSGKVSSYIGSYFPLFIYGSYLAVGVKA